MSVLVKLINTPAIDSRYAPTPNDNDPENRVTNSSRVLFGENPDCSSTFFISFFGSNHLG